MSWANRMTPERDVHFLMLSGALAKRRAKSTADVSPSITHQSTSSARAGNATANNKIIVMRNRIGCIKRLVTGSVKWCLEKQEGLSFEP